MSNDEVHDPADPTVRAGVFTSLAEADRAVHNLLDAGFAKGQITVICSDEAKEQHFREFERQQPAGTNTPAAATAGSGVGAAVGGATAVAVGIATGALPLAIVGGAGLLTGGVVGGFLGAMLTRGVEKEAADFYDQAVQSGRLLVTVERQEDDGGPPLSRAEEVLARAGAQPLPLPEG